MIITYKNKPCLVLEQYNHLGPEPHYRCLFENDNIVLAIQPSGRIVKLYCIEYNRDFVYYTEEEFLHRECGPAIYSCFWDLEDYRHYNIKENICDEEYYLQGFEYTKEEFDNKIKDFYKTKIII